MPRRGAPGKQSTFSRVPSYVCGRGRKLQMAPLRGAQISDEDPVSQNLELRISGAAFS